MIKVWSAIGLLLVESAASMAGTLDLVLPADSEDVPRFTLYSADDPTPVARIENSWPLELPAGRYTIGVGDYPARLAPFDMPGTGTVEVPLAALAITAPEGSVAQLALFTADDGSLVSPLVAPTTLLLPPGTYSLRRDLGSDEQSLLLVAGEVMRLDLGALRPDPTPGSEQWPLLLARPGEAKIAIAAARLATLALPPGPYLVTASPDVLPVAIDIVAGETAALPVPVIEIVGNRTDTPFSISAAGTPIAEIPPGWSGQLPLAGHGRTVTVGDHDLMLATDGPTLLWRMADASLPQADGLALVLQAGSPPRLVPGSDARFAVETLSRVDVAFTLTQKDTAPRILPVLSFARGDSPWIVPIPADISSGSPATLVARVTGPGGLDFEAHSASLDVHPRLLASVENLAVSETSATTVALAWIAPAQGRIVGYNVYRGAAPHPLNGTRPLPAPGYTDFGLSAGRSFAYRVCPVDDLSLEGPCAEIKAATMPR